MISIHSKIFQLSNLAKSTSALTNVQKNTNQAISTNDLLSIKNGKLDISSEAREKLTIEVQAQKDKITQQLKDSAKASVEESKDDSENDYLDQLIEQIQEQIKEIKQKLHSLDRENSEQSRQEKKMLESQLMSLNGTLMSLFGKKLKALEEGAK